MIAVKEAKTTLDKKQDKNVDLERVLQYFREAEESSDDYRTYAEKDRDYYDNKQWTEEEVAELKRRKQPIVTYNRIKPKVDFLLGTERQSRADPRAFPRTPIHEEDADSITDALRYVADNNDFDQAASYVAENLFIEGIGACEVTVKPTRRGGIEVIVNYIPWDRQFIDPHARKRDRSDARYRGQVIWMDIDGAKDKWPDADNILSATVSERADTGTFDDKPTDRWTDSKRKRVRIIEMYYRMKGEYYRCVFTKGGFLESPKLSPFTNEDGETEDPYEFVVAYSDRENQPYGVVRQLIDIQDEINKRRSKSLHLLNVNQVITEPGAVEDPNRARREVAKPDGWIEVAPDMRFEIQRNLDLSTAHFQMLQEAKSEIDAVGANAALAGKTGESASGRAIQARQQGGMMELGPLFDSLRHWKRRVYRKIWHRIRQFWNEEKWIRVTDDERNIRWVGLNKPVTLAEALQDPIMAQDPQVRAIAQRLQEAQAQGVAVDPRLLQQPIAVKNRVSEIDVDIIIDEMPDVVTLQLEQFEQLVNLASSGYPIPPEMIIEASSLRNKDKIMQYLESQQQSQSKLAEAQTQKDEMEAQKTQSEIAENMARAQGYQADAYKKTVEAQGTELQQQLMAAFQ